MRFSAQRLQVDRKFTRSTRLLAHVPLLVKEPRKEALRTDMRKLDTIVWSIGARQRRLHISSTTPVWGTGTPLASWLSQIDFWSRSTADGHLVSLCEIVQRHAGDSEHRVLEADGDTI